MLWFLYPKSDSFDGLGGTESNLDAEGNEAKVFKITPDMQNACYYPLANPAEGFPATNEQLFGSATPRESSPPSRTSSPSGRSIQNMSIRPPKLSKPKRITSTDAGGRPLGRVLR